MAGTNPGHEPEPGEGGAGPPSPSPLPPGGRGEGEGGSAPPPPGSGSWPGLVPAMARGASLGAYHVQEFFRAYGYAFFTAWFPAYLEKAYGVETAAAGEWATWPLVA